MKSKYGVKKPEVAPGWLTIYSGPAGSGKSKEYKEQYLLHGKDTPVRVIHGDSKWIQKAIDLVNEGTDVIFETTMPVKSLPDELLDVAGTIEIFRKG